MESMSQTIALFGGGGFVGGNLALAALRRGWTVYIVDSLELPGVPGAHWHRVDITDAAAVGALLDELRPVAVVDLAAVADIDRAEREQDLAWAVNVAAARTIASASAALGSAFLYFSSDAVFAGTASRYTEEDPPSPVNYYGRTKAEGEKAVLAAHPGAGIVRISLALGFPVTGGNSFFAALEAGLKAGKEITAPSDEVRTPVDVHTLSECVLELLGMRHAGVIHIGSTDSIDRATLTRRAAALMGFPDARIIAQPGEEQPAGAHNTEAQRGGSKLLRAPRHKNGIISVAKAQRLLRTPLLSAEQSIHRAIVERN
jgi:dTDP-4-dehydrorhamnose reductase